VRGPLLKSCQIPAFDGHLRVALIELQNHDGFATLDCMLHNQLSLCDLPCHTILPRDYLSKCTVKMPQTLLAGK
jgi:hypothetical protein